MSGTMLAIEWSSSRISVAWQTRDTRGGEVLALQRFQAELALPMLGKVVAGLSELRTIRIGRGPGNYSGIRQSLAWAIGYCAPGGIALCTAASGDAQAYRLQRSVLGPFAILGDARRGVWWGKTFPEAGQGWRLQAPQAWIDALGDMPVFSQEAVRLQGLGLNLQADYPQASDLLALPEGKMTLDLNPLYLHPAV
jgi:tRNA A37 threonylcarbamoyladenosine modification protein TsaB